MGRSLSFPGGDVFERAKRISLSAFLERELGVTAKCRGRFVRFSSCPDATCRAAVNPRSERLLVRDDAGFRCFRCGARGSIIDAAMRLWGLATPLDAARAVLNEPNAPPRILCQPDPRLLEEARQHESVLVETLHRLRAAADLAGQDERNLRYLCEERAIPLAVVREAQHRRLLGFLPSSRRAATRLITERVGGDLLTHSGLWNCSRSECPWIASRPIVFFFPGMTAAEFRLNRRPRTDEKKCLQRGSTQYPWFWRGTDATRAIVVEGFIDLLSVVALGYPGHVIGVPGCNHWEPEWFARMQAQGVRHIDIGLDDDVQCADNPGQTWGAFLAEYLDELGLEYCITKHPGGDMNDLLRARHVPQAMCA